MTSEEIKEKIIFGINDFLDSDHYLIIHNLNERTITHRLAIFLSKYFEDYNVDCEYNGDIERHDGKKRIHFLKEQLLNRNLLRIPEFELEKEIIERAVYPDIIIHERGTNNKNLCVIEVKKSTSKVIRDYDFMKLQAYTSIDYGNTLNYQLGIFIEFIIARKPGFRLEYFKNGEIIPLM